MKYFFKKKFDYSTAISLASLVFMVFIVYVITNYRIYYTDITSLYFYDFLNYIAKILFYRIEALEESLLSHGYADRAPVIVFAYVSCFWVAVLFSFLKIAVPKTEKERNYGGGFPNKVDGITILLILYLIFYRDYDYGMTDRLGDRAHLYDEYMYWIPIYVGAFVEAIFFICWRFVYFLRQKCTNLGGGDVQN